MLREIVMHLLFCRGSNNLCALPVRFRQNDLFNLKKDHWDSGKPARQQITCGIQINIKYYQFGKCITYRFAPKI